MTKHTIGAQVGEAKRELGLRQSAYPGWVGRGRMRQGEADHHLDLQRSIVSTLQWLQKNEAAVRGYVDALNAAPELKGRRPLVLFFDNDADADEFVAAFKEAKPGVKTVKL